MTFAHKGTTIRVPRLSDKSINTFIFNNKRSVRRTLIVGGNSSIVQHFLKKSTGLKRTLLLRRVMSKPTAAFVQLFADVSVIANLRAVLIHQIHTFQLVMHFAGIVQDRGFYDVSYEQMAYTHSAKACGTINLHRLFTQTTSDFIFASSVATFGNIGQLCYSSANSYLDAFARLRRTRGTSGTSCQLNLVYNTGIAAEIDHVQIQTLKIPTMTSRQTIDLLLYACTGPVSTHPVIAFGEGSALQEFTLTQSTPIRAPELIARAPLDMREIEIQFEKCTLDYSDTDLLELDSITLTNLVSALCTQFEITLPLHDVLLNIQSKEKLKEIVLQQIQTSNKSKIIQFNAWIFDTITVTCTQIAPLARYIPTPENIDVCEIPIIFILCSPRSGSSLLQLCLNANDNIYAGQELFLLMFKTMGERRLLLKHTSFDEGLTKTYMELTGKSYIQTQEYIDKLPDSHLIATIYDELQSLAHPRILVDKTPSNVHHINIISKSKRWVNAMYVHTYRHPYPCITSSVQLGRDILNQAVDTEEMAKHWFECNMNTLNFLEFVRDSHKISTSYEELCGDTRKVTQKTCEQFNIEWCTSMADPYSDTNAMRSFLPAHRIATTDPKLLTKIGINTDVSEQWLDTHCTLDDRSILLANRLHYTLRPMSPGYWNVHKFCKHHTHTAFFIPDFSNNCLPAFDLQLEDMTVIACKTTLEILHKSKTMSRLAQFHAQAVTPNMCIIAYSLGCRIAYRMACILHTAGIRTFLILIDGLIGHDDDSDERMKGLVPLCVQYLDGVCQSTGDVKLDKVIQTINNLEYHL